MSPIPDMWADSVPVSGREASRRPLNHRLSSYEQRQLSGGANPVGRTVLSHDTRAISTPAINSHRSHTLATQNTRPTGLPVHPCLPRKKHLCHRSTFEHSSSVPEIQIAL